jgi:hypothetical protein
MNRNEQFTALETGAKTMKNLRVINKGTDGGIIIQFKNDGGTGTV